ncbi:LysM peptidoglycan-binding domain-containing protein [Pendulispora brunnea]|uniref:LysM peptidoglycan-binding domain-containing protein n=1 Tax=Pendulispora brunnea TaxID=2905690 RepID=A0ABZ2KS05_9BACT
MFFSRVGFLDGPWEFYRLPGGEDYRITPASISASFSPESSPFEGERRMAAITFWCFNESVAPDPSVVDGLLEIHQWVKPNARRVRARDVLREWRHRDYLHEVARDLRCAVKTGLLRVELIPRYGIAFSRDKTPSERPPEQAKGEASDWVAFRLVDQDGEPVARRRFVLTGADKDERQGVLTSAGRERFERMAPGECKLVFGDFDVSDFSEPRALAGKQAEDTELVKSEGAAEIHVVKSEDTPWSISGKYGFENFETIWNAAENKGLRERRANAQGLAAGDELAIPEKKPKTLTLATAKETSFTVYLAKRQVRLWLLDHEGQRVPVGTPYRFTAGTVVRDGKTVDAPDGKGGSILIEERVPAHLERAFVEWGTRQPSEKSSAADPKDQWLKRGIEALAADSPSPFILGSTDSKSATGFPYAGYVNLQILDGSVVLDAAVEGRLRNRALFLGDTRISLALFAREYGIASGTEEEELRKTLRNVHRDGEPSRIDTSGYGDWVPPDSEEMPA